MDVSPSGVTARPRADLESSTLWLTTVLIGLGLCVVVALTPTSWVGFRELFIYLLTDAIAVAAIVVGVLRYKPTAPGAWLFIDRPDALARSVDPAAND
jgi:hypothetical protein